MCDRSVRTVRELVCASRKLLLLTLLKRSYVDCGGDDTVAVAACVEDMVGLATNPP